MEKKYILTDQEIKFHETILHRIVAIRDFGNTKAGQLGGFVESEKNLSHEGICWIWDESKVFENAEIRDNAIISDNAVICGEAIVDESAIIRANATISDQAHIGGRTCINGEAIVRGHACIIGGSAIFGNTIVEEFAFLNGANANSNAKISGNAWLSTMYRVGKDAFITKPNDILLLGPIGSRKDMTTFYYTEDKRIMVCCGCFNSTLEEFSKKVIDEYRENNEEFYQQYMAAIEFARKVMH